MKKTPDGKNIANDGRSAMKMTPIRESSEKRGRDAMGITAVPTVKSSSTQTEAQPQAAKQSGESVEKGRGAVPMVEVKPESKPATTPEKKK
jgi:hypothetical protein